MPKEFRYKLMNKLYMEEAEVWKKIEGCEIYEVSSFGNIRNSKTGRILKQGKKGGYCSHIYVCSHY